MSANGEAAEQVTRIMLEGTEVLLRLTGKGAERAAVLLCAALNQQKKTKGAVRLSNMLRSGKLLRVYTFEEKDLPKFKEVAKQYGILYSILKEKDKTDGVFDVLVRADDENKINRIIERFSLTKLDTTALKAELEKEKQAREQAGKAEDKSSETKEAEGEAETVKEGEQKQEAAPSSRSDQVADELMGHAEPTTRTRARAGENPDAARAEAADTASPERIRNGEESRLSEPSLRDTKSPTARSDAPAGRKPSVRAELEELKKARAVRIRAKNQNRDRLPVMKDKPIER